MAAKCKAVVGGPIQNERKAVKNEDADRREPTVQFKINVRQLNKLSKSMMMIHWVHIGEVLVQSLADLAPGSRKGTGAESATGSWQKPSPEVK